MLRRTDMLSLIAFHIGFLVAGSARAQEYDVVLRGGTVYDGSGRPPVVADVAVRGDTIAAVGDLGGAKGRREIDARGRAVAPGFINMLSWAPDSLSPTAGRRATSARASPSRSSARASRTDRAPTPSRPR